MRMSQRKQTARKTTGSHLELTSTLARSAAASKSAKRVRHARTTTTATTSAGPSGSRSKASPTKSILRRPSVTVRASIIDLVDPGNPVTPHRTTSHSSTNIHVNSPLSTRDPPSNGTALTPGPVATGSTSSSNRNAASCNALPISLWTRFATWLEDQTCVDENELLRAVERDGVHLLSLAKATVMFDNALHGNVPPCTNGIAHPLSERARTLRVFVELLKSKISDGGLSEELEMAVLRDGDALIRLAQSCLDFDRAIRGSSSAT